MSKVKNFRVPDSIKDYFKERGEKIANIFRLARITPIVVEKSIINEYYAGSETPIRLSDDEYDTIKDEADKLDMLPTVYMRLLMINYYQLENMEGYQQ